jgi:tRNA(His) 5'-end guanylyltransferase
MTLRERLEQYEESADLELTKRLPLVIRSELRNYKKISQNLDKPYCPELSEIMANAMLYAIVEIQDAVFGFCHSGECSFILRNDIALDQSAWLQNNVQRITSTVSSLMTIGFYKYHKLCYEDLNLSGDAIFNTKIFALPSLSECSNYILWRQMTGMSNSVSEATAYELEGKFGRETAIKMMNGTSAADKAELLLHHCGIDFHENYPPPFVRGVAGYKRPIIVGGISKNKWHLDYEVPEFVDDKSFVSNILVNGRQLFTSDTLIKLEKD